MGSTQQTKTSCFRARESPWFLGGDCHGFKSDPARLHLLSGIQHDYLTTQREFQRDCQNLIHLSMLIYTLWIWHETHETQEWPYPLSTRENHLWNSQIRGSILNGVCLIMGYDGPSQNCNFKRDKDFSTKVFFPWSVRCPSGHRGENQLFSSGFFLRASPHHATAPHWASLSNRERNSRRWQRRKPLQICRSCVKHVLGVQKIEQSWIDTGLVGLIGWDFRENLEEPFWNFNSRIGACREWICIIMHLVE